MSDPSQSDLDAALRAEPDRRARARLLTIDYDAVHRTTRRIQLGSFLSLLATVVFVAYPITILILALSGYSEGLLLHVMLLGLLGVLLVNIFVLAVVQVLLRVGRRWRTETVQLVAGIVQPVLETVGLFVAIVVLRDSPESVVGIVSGSIVRAAIYGASAASTLRIINKNPRNAVWMIEQHRSLPPTATALGNSASRVVAAVAGRALTSVGLATLLWIDPTLVVPLAIVSAAVSVALNRLLFTARFSEGMLVLWGWAAVQLAFSLVAGRAL